MSEAKPETIPVFISSDDNYAMHLCATVASVVDNSGADFGFHILYDSLSEKSMESIRVSAGRHQVEFFHVDKKIFEKFDVKLEHLSLEACFRYMIPTICPDMPKAVYLDCDVIVLGDLAEYYNSDISGCYAGVGEDFVRDSYIHKLGLKRYFNSGVMLFNLEQMRMDGMTEKLFKKSEELSGTSKFLDQDALNILFKDKLKFLKLRWNATAPLFRKKVKYKGDPAEVGEAIYSPGALHFTGPDKPWKIPYGLTAHPYTPAYLYYLRKTPYAKCADQMMADFKPVSRFWWYFKRHLFFFMRPAFFKMRALYKKNKLKYAK